MKSLDFRKLFRTIKPGMFLRTDDGVSVLTGGQILDALTPAISIIKRIEILSKALDNGIRNCLGNARLRKDDYDIGYLEAMRKNAKEIKDSVRLLNPTTNKNIEFPDVALSENDLEVIDDALETMELHGMHSEKAYKTLKTWHRNQTIRISGQ